MKCAVAHSLCGALLRDLAGFRGYPKDGEGRFIDVLQEISISVDHARAIVLTFEETFPTIREMRDVAMNLRQKFEPTVDQRAAWEKEYGKPSPVSLDVAGSVEKSDADLWRQIIKRIPDRKKLQMLSWPALAAIARELGYDEHAHAWERSQNH